MKCNHYKCDKNGKLFGKLFTVEFYYCEKHFKLYEKFINRFTLRTTLLRLKHKNYKKYCYVQSILNKS